MEFQSTGLGSRHLDISWEKGKTQVTVEDTRDLWGAVLSPVPTWLLESSPNNVVVVRGETRLPVVWRYFSALSESDYQNILKIALSQKAVDFLTRFGGRRRLFFRLAGLVLLFFWHCMLVWITKTLKKKRESRPTIRFDTN